jgi:hypothetical protein
MATPETIAWRPALGNGGASVTVDRVRHNRYPGRGVLWTRTLNGALAGGYFLTGRSPASQARNLHRDGRELIVSPTDQNAHDPLRHYAAAREVDRWLVFGNGEQVATVATRLHEGSEPATALDTLARMRLTRSRPIMVIGRDLGVSGACSRWCPNADGLWRAFSAGCGLVMEVVPGAGGALGAALWHMGAAWVVGCQGVAGPGHHWLAGTPALTSVTCLPQPAQVLLPQVLQRVG